MTSALVLSGFCRASLQQSGLELPDGDVLSLTGALFDEAAGGEEGPCDTIDIDQLKRVFAKHPGLLDSLGDRFELLRTFNMKQSD